MCRRPGACWLLVAGALTICPLSQAPRVCRAGADLGGPPPALCAGFQPNCACVEARLRAAGVVRQPRAEVWAGTPGSGVGVRRPGWGVVLISGPSWCNGGPAGRRGLRGREALRGTGISWGRQGPLQGFGHMRREKRGAQPAEFCGTAVAEPWASFPEEPVRNLLLLKILFQNQIKECLCIPLHFL